MDFSNLTIEGILAQNANINMDILANAIPIQPKINTSSVMPNITTWEERQKPLLDELKLQTSELEKVHYENMKLNAQINVLNKTNDEQLTQISELKADNIVSKNTIAALNNTINEIQKKNKHQRIKDALCDGIVTVVFGLVLQFLISYLFT